MYIFSLPGFSLRADVSLPPYIRLIKIILKILDHFQRILMRTWFPALFVFQDIQNKVKIPPKDNFLTFKVYMTRNFFLRFSRV